MDLSFFLFALFLGAASAVPLSNKQLATRVSSRGSNLGIYNGNTTKMNDHRYLVGILYQEEFQCAGVIVSATWILTIADCTYGLTAADLIVVGSSWDGVTGKRYSVTSVVEHPDYGTNALDFDFACIQVERKFYYWQWRSHKLPTADPDDYTIFTVAGYGYTTQSATTRALRKASMELLPRPTCDIYYEDYVLNWTPRLRCAYNPAGATLCEGDYGDAFVSGKVLYGLFVAEGSDQFCTSSALPVVMANVYPVSTWINEITGAEYA